ncbi:hypothetical protein KY285_012785 [Solanum tuberosum]|nr:hypothetical protein KY285_012785 [Solanum tuberosum]
MEYAKSGVLNEEMRRRSQDSSSSTSHSDVLVTKDRGSKFRCQNDRDKSRGKSKSRFKNVTCDYCHKNVHIKKYCLRRLSHMSEKGMDNLAKNNLLSGSHPPSRKLDLLELVHSDMCGPFKALVERLTGKKLKCIRSDKW